MKMSNENMILFLVAGIAAVLWYSNARKKGTLPKLLQGKGSNTANTNTSTAGASGTVGSSTNNIKGTGNYFSDDYIRVQLGDSGPAVKQLQQEILKKIPTALPIYGADGHFGNETLAALQKYWGVTGTTPYLVRTTPIRSNVF